MIFPLIFILALSVAEPPVHPLQGYINAHRGCACR